MATFTALAKIYSTEYFYNTKVAGLGEIFVQRKFCHIRYAHREYIALLCKYTKVQSMTLLLQCLLQRSQG